MEALIWLTCLLQLFPANPSTIRRSRYKTEYGNVVSENIGHSKPDDSVIEFITKELSTSSDKLNLIKLDVMPQYHSDDGLSPSKILYTDNSRCYALTTRIGTLYIAMVTVSDVVVHSLKIVKDQNNQFQLYHHVYYDINNVPSIVSKKPNLSLSTNSDSGLCNANTKCSPGCDWSTVTIATYNIWNINSTKEEKHWKRLKRAAKALSSVDIIGLQEVRSVTGQREGLTVNQIRTLAQALPNYQFVYQPGMLFRHTKRDEEGVAIMSRYPIVSTDYILLPWNQSDPSDFHQRVCLQCTVQTPSGLVNVFVTHLSLSESAQINSVVEIYRYMEKFAGPSVLLGDLNSEPLSVPIKFLSGEVRLKSIRVSGLYDAWAHLEFTDGETFSALGKKPVKRIDYIFLKENGDVCIESVNFIGKKSKRPLSDHYGLTIKIRLR